jgi:hypothetical protein
MIKGARYGLIFSQVLDDINPGIFGEELTRRIAGVPYFAIFKKPFRYIPAGRSFSTKNLSHPFFKDSQVMINFIQFFLKILDWICILSIMIPGGG